MPPGPLPVTCRPGSPRFGFSTFTTSAPIHARASVQVGPASNCVRSTTFTPFRQLRGAKFPLILLVSSTLGTSPEQRSGTITQDGPSRKSSIPRIGMRQRSISGRRGLQSCKTAAMRFRQQQQHDDHQPEGGGAADREQQIEGHVSPPASFRRAAPGSQPSRTMR